MLFKKKDKIDIDEEFATIKWCIADIKVLFDEREIPFTQENLDILFENIKVSSIIDLSIQYGWEILNDMINCTEEKFNYRQK